MIINGAVALAVIAGTGAAAFLAGRLLGRLARRPTPAPVTPDVTRGTPAVACPAFPPAQVMTARQSARAAIAAAGSAARRRSLNRLAREQRARFALILAEENEKWQPHAADEMAAAGSDA